MGQSSSIPQALVRKSQEVESLSTNLPLNNHPITFVLLPLLVSRLRALDMNGSTIQSLACRYFVVRILFLSCVIVMCPTVSLNNDYMV
jgi:uncharacterized MAPEG superfamily protein